VNRHTEKLAKLRDNYNTEETVLRTKEIDKTVKEKLLTLRETMEECAKLGGSSFILHKAFGDKRFLRNEPIIDGSNTSVEDDWKTLKLLEEKVKELNYDYKINRFKDGVGFSSACEWQLVIYW